MLFLCKDDGSLINVAPTILEYMDIAVPKEMAGTPSLIASMEEQNQNIILIFLFALKTLKKMHILCLIFVRYTAIIESV